MYLYGKREQTSSVTHLAGGGVGIEIGCELLSWGQKEGRRTSISSPPPVILSIPVTHTLERSVSASFSTPIRSEFVNNLKLGSGATDVYI